MRGKPILNWVVFLALWAGLAYPIAQVMRSEQGPARETGVDTEATTTWITLRFSSPPSSFTLVQEDSILWQEDQPEGLLFEDTLPVLLDVYGAELTLRAALEDRETAVEITLEPDGRAARAQTLWTRGDLEKTAFFTWGAR